ncbi:MAG TPA: hypothetical protein VEI97_07250, partial [bacterium]|nr:hypothetical protein [bacterium]
MRRTSALLVTLAALLSVFGCGGGSGVTDPDPNPGPGLAALEGDITRQGAFIGGATVVAFDLTTGVELDREPTDA